MPRIACSAPVPHFLDGYRRTEISAYENDLRKVDAIAKGDFAIHQDLAPYSIDRGNFRIVHIPTGLNVAYGGITSVEMAAKMVDRYAEHSTFLADHFDRIAKRDASKTDEYFDRFCALAREVRRSVAGTVNLVGVEK